MNSDLERAVDIWLRELIAEVVAEVREEKKQARDDWSKREFAEHCGL